MVNEENDKDGEIRVLADSEKELLFSSIPNIRDLILIKVLYETGCNLQAVCKIRLLDFDFSKCTLKLFNESNIIGRECFLSHKLCADVKAFVRDTKKGKEDFIFATRQSESMTPKRVAQIIEYYLRRIGINDRTGKCIRYTHIVDAYKNKVSMDQIEKQVGIKKPRLVQICGSVKVEKDDAYDNFF